MQKILFVVVMTIAALTLRVNAQKVSAITPPPPLVSVVVVIDPGHGGKDPGSNGVFESTPVYEAAYTYDVALRVKRMVTALGGKAFLSIIDGQKENNEPASKVFLFDHAAKFALDGTGVVALSAGLSKRLAYGNRINAQYPSAKVAWVSIHFDKLGTNTDIHGVRIIAPDKELRLAKALEKSFDDAHRLRADDPVVASGDKDHGLRRLYVLSNRNHILQRVLVELGNFNHKGDMYRIRAAQVREDWAAAITKALGKF